MQIQAQWDTQAHLIIVDPITWDIFYLAFALACEQALSINSPPSGFSFWVQFARGVSQ